jgi:hypothetical protein
MPAPARATKAARRQTSRDNPNRPRPAAPILIVGSSIAGAVLTLTFDQPVSLSGVPKFTTDLGEVVPVGAAKTAQSVVAITFSAPVTGAVNLNVGFRDPAIRNASGGYVTSDSVVL